MSRKRTFTIACLLSVVLAISILSGSPQVFGQDIVTGTVTGVRVRLDGSWVHVPSASGDDGEIDTLVFTSQTGNFVLNAGTKDIDYVLEIVPAGSRVTDIDVGTTYAVRAVRYHDATFGLFSVAVDDTVQTIISPPDDFASIMRDARTNINVNGSTIFFGVDEAQLARLLPDDGDRGSSVALIRGDLFQSTTPVAVNATPVVEGKSGTSIAPASPLVNEPGRHVYDAPWSGMRVNWNDNWQIDVRDGTLMVSSSLEGYQYDEICLQPARPIDGVTVCVSVYQSGAMDNADVWRDHYASGTATSRFGTPYYFVHITDTSVTYAEFDVQGEGVAISQSVILDGKRLTVEVVGSSANIVEIVGLAKSGIHLDGSPVLDSVKVEEFRSETDAVIASLPTYQQERDSYLTGMGMVEPTHFVSVAMGCDVQWNAPLELDGLTTTTPIDHTESGNAQPVVASERFTLVMAGESPASPSIAVECLQHLPSIESWTPWSDATQSLLASRYVTVEGAWAYYVVDSTGSLNIVLKPLGGPAVVVSIRPGPNGLRATMDAMEPGMLIINGVDVFRAFENDGIAGLVP